MNSLIKIFIISGLIFNTSAKDNKLKLQKLLFETEKLIPTIEEVEGNFNNEVQTIPFEYFQVAENLREMDKHFLRSKKAQRPILAFQESCINNERTTRTIRALCLTHFIANNKSLGKKIELDKYPEELTELTKYILE